MPNSVIYSGLVELFLIVITLLLLSRPQSLFRKAPPKIYTMAGWGGVMFLFLTFFWSIVFGIVLSMNQLTLRF